MNREVTVKVNVLPLSTNLMSAGSLIRVGTDDAGKDRPVLQATMRKAASETTTHIQQRNDICLLEIVPPL